MIISINILTINYKDEIVVKLSLWFCGWIEFYVYLPFILNQFVISLCAKFLFSALMRVWGIYKQITFNKVYRLLCSVYDLFPIVTSLHKILDKMKGLAPIITYM